MQTISLRLPDDLVADLKKAAKDRGVTKTSVVREILVETLRAKPSEPSCHDLSKHLIFKRGRAPRDLATNPKYMEGFGE